MTLREQLIATGLFRETDTRDIVCEEETVEAHEFSGEHVRVGYEVRLKFDPFGDLEAVCARRFDPAMRDMVKANRLARLAKRKTEAG